MWNSTDNRLCINDTIMSTARVMDDGGIIVSAGISAVHLPPGPDADAFAAKFGLDNTPVTLGPNGEKIPVRPKGEPTKEHHQAAPTKK